MSQLFKPSFNTIAKVSIIATLGLVGFLFWAQYELHLGPYITRKNIVRDQPIMFTHKHHVSDIGIDCRYCHTAVEESSSAGIPPTQTCMNCHSQIWAQAPMLEPVRQSYATKDPIEWIKVHDTPDHVYFNHSIHIAKGMACQTCHGQVDQMPMIWQHQNLTMSFCLDCHNNPEKYVRPREEVFNMDYKVSASEQAALGKKLVADYHIQSLTNCTTCHR